MSSTTPRSRLAWLALALVPICAAIQQVRATWAEATAFAPTSGADALPLFLGARAVSTGHDPTDATHLEYLYNYAELNVSKELFSVLYPASLHVMLQPMGDYPWPTFLHWWRQVIFVVFIGGLAAAGTVAVNRYRAPLAAGLALLCSFVLFPRFCMMQLGMGQPNLLIVGLIGAAMAFAAWGVFPAASLLATLGAGIKLVPAVLLWPMLIARKWTALGIAAAAGGALAVLTMVQLSPGVVVANLWETYLFQQGVEPAWLAMPELPDWTRFLGFLRRPALMIFSLVLSAAAVLRTREQPRKQAEVISVAFALFAAALAADSTGVGAYYATMSMPAMICILTWPLARGAPRYSIALLPLVAAMLFVSTDGFIYAVPYVEPKLVAACMVLWAGTAIRLIHLGRPWPIRAHWVAAALLAIALIHASIWTWRPPGGRGVFVPQPQLDGTQPAP